jgi:sugar lactone lactonase YvrE
MLNKLLFFCFSFILICKINAQNVGVGTPNPIPSAKLEVSSTTSGFMPPRMTAFQRENISSPAAGLIIYCTNCGSKGEWQGFNGTEWTNISGTPASAPIVNALTSFNVSVTDRQNTSVSLQWTSVVNNYSSDSVKYKITLNGTTIANNISSNSFVLNDLNPNNVYNGTVNAYSLRGDTSSATFSIGIATRFASVIGFYKVTESSKVLSSGAVSNYTFYAQAILLNDSTIKFVQSRRIPRTWWTADFSTQIYPALNDSLIGGGITPRGRILNATTIRMGYLYGSSVVYDVKQLWEKFSNPADTNTIVYTYPNVPNMISTVAGNSTGGASGSTGDGGLATAAGLVAPYDVVADNAGNVYLTDGGTTYSIRKVSPNGIITRFAGNNTSGFSGDGGLAVNAQINYPQGIAIDNAGNIIFSDGGNRIIRKVDANGIISTIAGIPGSYGYSGDGGMATNAQMGLPAGLSVDAAGNIYVADIGKHVIRKIATDGIITTVAGIGTNGFSGDGGLATAAKLNAPTDVWVDANNNLFISDRDNHAVRKVTAAGIISTIAGIGGSLNYGFTGDGGAATTAKLYSPYSVSVDNLGNVYLSDKGNNRIRKITTNGIISTIAGNGASATLGDGPDFYGGDYGNAANASVGYPYGNFWINSKLFIVTSNRVRKITF